MGLRIILCISSLISFVYGAGELLILNSPDSLRWKGNAILDENLLKEVYSAAMGYTVEKNSNWNGMYIQDPFNYPEALVHVAIEGVTNLGKYSPLDVPKYPLNTDEDEYATWRAMKHRVQDRHPENNNTLVHLDLSRGLQELNKYPDILSDLSIELNYPSSEELQVDIEENRKFFEEIAVMNAISEKIKLMKDHLQDTNQDIYWFVFTSLHAVSDFHGPDSRGTAQAREILIDSLQKLTHNLNEAYNGRVLVTAVTSDASHTRRARALLAEDAATGPAVVASTESSKTVAAPTANINPHDSEIGEFDDIGSIDLSTISTPETTSTETVPEYDTTQVTETTSELETTVGPWSERTATEPFVFSTEQIIALEKVTYPNTEPPSSATSNPTVNGTEQTTVPYNGSTGRPVGDVFDVGWKWPFLNDTYVPAGQNDFTKWNLAHDYSENYPVIFNIILWFGVAFLFSLLAVCYVIATMDPGRDSIIYRMTSNRMKKEN